MPAIATICPAPQPDSQMWLDAELDWAWLLAERRLRALQRDGLRPTEGDEVAEIDAILDRRQLAGAPGPDSDAAFADALTSTRALVDALRAGTPLGRLAAALALPARHVDLLMLSIAPHIDPGLERVFTLLQNDYTRRGVDLALIAELLGLDRTERTELLAAIDEDSALVRFAMLQPCRGDGSALHQRLQPVLDVVGLALGRNPISAALRGAAQLVQAPANLDDLVFAETERERMTELVRATASLLRTASPPWLLLWGPRGIGKRELAARTAAAAGMELLALDPRLVTNGRGDAQLRRAQRDALANDAALYIGPVGDELLADAGHGLVQRLREFPGAVVFGVEATQPPQFRAPRPVHEIPLTGPDGAGRRELWRRNLPADPDVDVPRLATAFKLTPGEIRTVCRDARAIDGDTVATATLRRCVDRLLRNELSGLASRIDQLPAWSDLVLPADQLERVAELIDRHRYADQVYERWELGARVGYGRGVVALFSGPPGTGKTMLAGVIAQQLGLDLYKVDLSQVVSKWVGETEKQLARIFELAERAHAVLLFDEADALLAKRTRVETSSDRHGNLAVNYLLQRLEAYDGIAILTTNRAKSLDDAVSRRLTMHLRLELPDEEQRASLWRSFLPATLPVAEDVDLEGLARRHELAGGNIKNVAVRAAFYAARAERAVDMAMLERALDMEMQDMGRLA